MQVNQTKHQTLHDISPRQYKPYVNKSYYVNTELEDEYEDDMDEYTEDEDTEDEDTEEEYGRYEDTEAQRKNTADMRILRMKIARTRN